MAGVEYSGPLRDALMHDANITLSMNVFNTVDPVCDRKSKLLNM